MHQLGFHRQIWHSQLFRETALRYKEHNLRQEWPLMYWGSDSKHKQSHLFHWVGMKPFENGARVHVLVYISHNVTLTFIFFFLNAKPKVRKEEDILPRQTLKEFHGFHGTIKPPCNFFLHRKKYKGVGRYLKMQTKLIWGCFSQPIRLYVQPTCSSLKTCRTRYGVWIIPQALTEPWYQSLLPHPSKTCFF